MAPRKRRQESDAPLVRAAPGRTPRHVGGSLGAAVARATIGGPSRPFGDSEFDDDLGVGPIPTREVLPPAIGVPPGYSARVDRRLDTRTGAPFNPDDPRAVGVGGRFRDVERDVEPTFHEGAQYAPASLPPAQVASLQRQLAAIGLIPPDAQVTLGVWDDVSVQAYERLLAFANRAGTTSVAEAFRRYEAGGGETLGPAAPPLQVRLTNPEELRSVFRRAVIDLLGEGWDSGRIDRMVNAYHATERRSQEQEDNLSVSEAAGTITDIPSPETFAEQQVRSEDPSGVEAREFLGTANEFFDLLGTSF